MPAPTTSTLTVLDSDLCNTCAGIGEEIDRDGALTGLAGALLPCGECGTHAMHDRPGEHCVCWSPLWRHNDGHTGWVPVPLDYVDDGLPMFSACLLHNTAIRAGLGIAPAAEAVAA